MRTIRVAVIWLPAAWLAAANVVADFAAAADHAAVLAPFVNDDTFFVGYADPAALTTPDAGQLMQRVISLAGESQATAVAGLSSGIQGLHAAGADDVYAIAGLRDLHVGGGPVVVVTVAPGRDVRAVENALRGAALVFQTAFAGPLRGPEVHVTRHPSGAILVGQQATLDRYMSAAPSDRADLFVGLAHPERVGPFAAAVFSPGPDFRRVVRELWPAFPEPLTFWKGELADRWLRLEFAAKSEPVPSAEMVMQATDAESAELFVRLLQSLPAASEQITELGNKRHELKRVLEMLLAAVPTRSDGSRIVMAVSTDEAQLAKLQGLLEVAGDAALESSRRHERIQQFKQMAIAMHSYMDKHKHLPPPAIRDKDGRPLLSWRVAILQYLEEDEPALFGKFHLDEPWDSPHNRALIQQMPAVYADPALPNLAREGKTTFVVPVGQGTVFDTQDGLPFNEIKDGSSKTVMIVEVPPENAVIWTKSDDWEVDMENPRQGFARTDRDYIVIASCDGAAHVWPTDIKPEVLRAHLTRAGGEVVDWP